MTLGEVEVPGNDEKHFNRPTDIAWLPDGTFFVSDGYANTRVVKFDKNGKFLHDVGPEGQRAERDAPRLHEHRARDRRSTRTAASTSAIAPTRASRCSTRTASSSTRGRTCGSRTRS